MDFYKINLLKKVCFDLNLEIALLNGDNGQIFHVNYGPKPHAFNEIPISGELTIIAHNQIITPNMNTKNMSKTSEIQMIKVIS